MSDAINQFVDAAGSLLPQLTVAVQCCSALINLGLAAGSAARQLRRRQRSPQR